ncbi:MAG: RagB/SusD family nutrient uptake outer membrane protein [Bacteroidaceae bacterium]|nr:RagB/SusD family nutrient uptake outer membrane protein [Bacteroidaceae bacterium]
MKIKKYIFPAVAAALMCSGLASCVKDLDVENINPQQVSKYDDDAVFNKVYGNMVLTGQVGPAGSGDIEDIDEGFSSMVRQIWNANELSTDEAKCIWGDAGIPEYNHNAWSDSHEMLRALYYRLYFGVTISNFYLEQSTMADRRAEVRFLRALHYYYLMDLYGNVPFLTTVTSEKAPQAARADIFKYIESELKAITEGSGSEVLMDAKQNSYGRADKVAAWMLLARMYLNAEVYTGTARWEDAKTYAEKVINSAYKLCETPKNGYSPFRLLFMGDNDTNGAQNEIILPAMHDGELTQTWGGALFVLASTVDEPILADCNLGTDQKWGGNHCPKQFVEKFFPNDDAPEGTMDDLTIAANDDRALFYTKGRTSSISDESDFKSGYAYVKFNNTHADGTAPHHISYVDIDFPMMRAAEAYLTFAEADARLNGGSCTADGLDKIKALRKRANANTNLSKFTTEQICDEWSREFAYEGMRRVTLVRFGKFGGQNKYKWEWMGGVKDGKSFDAHYNIFPIPASDLNANENLKQNPGY